MRTFLNYIQTKKVNEEKVRAEIKKEVTQQVTSEVLKAVGATVGIVGDTSDTYKNY